MLEARVPRAEAWLHQVWENTSEAMALSDPDGIVLAANPAYYKLYGYGPEDVLGKSFALIFPDSERAWAEALYRDVFSSDVPPPVMQSRVTSKSGDERVVEARTSFLEEHGRRMAMLSIVRDVTEEVAARRAAARAEHNLRTVLLGLSHDIKSPLAVIKGHAQMLRRSMIRQSAAPPLERLTNSLAHIDSSASRVAGLVDELVELATLQDTASLPLHLVCVDLIALVREAVDRHQRLADGHEIKAELATQALDGYWDSARLVRVLDNLLSNAIKYSPAGGLITVSVAPAGNAQRDGALLSVEDSGIGIDEHDLPHIFEPFHRGGNVPDTIGGSGIGLASVEQIVQQHGGTVHVASRSGAGTRVTVWLPVHQCVDSNPPA